MINPLPAMIYPLQASLFGLSSLLLMGFLFGSYWKSTFWQEGSRRDLDRRRAWRIRSDWTMRMEGPIGAEARVVDFSLTGLCFAAAESLDPGVRIAARVHASRGALLEVRGQVVWIGRQEQLNLYGLRLERVAELVR